VIVTPEQREVKLHQPSLLGSSSYKVARCTKEMYNNYAEHRRIEEHKVLLLTIGVG